MNVNERLFCLLEKMNDCQAKLARYLGISQSNITSWKNRHTDPPTKYLLQICEFLGVSCEFLLTGTEQQKNNASDLSEDDQKALYYYNRLTNEEKDEIKGDMVKMYRVRVAAGGAQKPDTEFGTEAAL